MRPPGNGPGGRKFFPSPAMKRLFSLFLLVTLLYLLVDQPTPAPATPAEPVVERLFQAAVQLMTKSAPGAIAPL